jgi:hypothetical protein
MGYQEEHLGQDEAEEEYALRSFIMCRSHGRMKQTWRIQQKSFPLKEVVRRIHKM